MLPEWTHQLPKSIRRVGKRQGQVRQRRALALAKFKSGFGSVSQHRLLLVGHDAHRHGAQLLLLHLAKAFVDLNVDVRILLLCDGDLAADYQEVCPTLIATDFASHDIWKSIKHCRFDGAICNTTVTGDWAPLLAEAGLSVVSLVHEMPRLLQAYGLECQAKKIAGAAAHVVFPAEIVQKGFTSIAPIPESLCVIRPQGSYLDFSKVDKTTVNLRTELNIPTEHKLILNVGFGDLRKGYDLFVRTALDYCEQREDVHFVWLGDIHEDLAIWLQADILSNPHGARVHQANFSADVAAYYIAADALLLSSREDPYPTVVLEALRFGLPIIAYAGCTGFDTVLAELGYIVQRDNQRGVSSALDSALLTNVEASAKRHAWVEEHCQFACYAIELLELVCPSEALQQTGTGA